MSFLEDFGLIVSAIYRASAGKAIAALCYLLDFVRVIVEYTIAALCYLLDFARVIVEYTIAALCQRHRYHRWHRLAQKIPE